MLLSEAITRVADDANIQSSVTAVKNRIIREINRICQEEWNGFRWSFRQRIYPLVTDVDYATGSITATNGSRTITGVGTTFLSTHKDWHIQFLQDPILNWYRVRRFTSATQLELYSPYQGTTGPNKTFVLRHFDYVLPTEPWDFGSIIVTHNRRPLSMVSPGSIDIIGPVPYYKGYPMAASIYGSDSVATTYTTGTANGTINTNILTGSGTSWLANVYPGDLFTVGSYTYAIRSVDTDTQITLYNNLQAAVAASAYTITRQFGRILRVMWPSTDNYVLEIRGLRIYPILVNDNDTNELLYRYPHPIILKVAALELQSQNDVRSGQMIQEATMALNKAKAEDEALTIEDNVAPIFSYRASRHPYRDSIR